MEACAHTFKKEERLKSRKVISSLFSGGSSVGVYPLRAVWLPTEGGAGSFPCQFALSVSKKKFPHATNRNRIRRLVRESYRLRKHLFYHELQKRGSNLGLMIIFTGKEMPDFKTVDLAMGRLLVKILKNLV